MRNPGELVLIFSMKKIAGIENFHTAHNCYFVLARSSLGLRQIFALCEW